MTVYVSEALKLLASQIEGKTSGTEPATVEGPINAVGGENTVYLDFSPGEVPFEYSELLQMADKMLGLFTHMPLGGISGLLHRGKLFENAGRLNLTLRPESESDIEFIASY